MLTASVMLYKTDENNVKGAAGKSSIPVLFIIFFGSSTEDHIYTVSLKCYKTLAYKKKMDLLFFEMKFKT